MDLFAAEVAHKLSIILRFALSIGGFALLIWTVAMCSEWHNKPLVKNYRKAWAGYLLLVFLFVFLPSKETFLALVQ